MKKISNSIWLILTIFCSSVSFAQITDYFPLNVGNFWQYRTWNPDGDMQILNKQITDVDTLTDGTLIYEELTNGDSKVYYKIKSTDKNTLYFCPEPANGIYYEYFKMNVTPYVSWPSMPVFWIRYDTSYIVHSQFGKNDTSLIYEMAYYNNFIYEDRIFHYALMKGIGECFGGGFGFDKSLWGCIINGVKYGTIVDVEDEITPKDYTLKINNYPNPFNPSTIINYTIPQNEFTKITIYDMLGREVEVLINGFQNSGTHSVNWSPKGVSSGMYLAVIKYKNQTLTQKMIYQK